MPFHYLSVQGVREYIACNADVWIPDELKVTSNKKDVTCGNCVRTKVFKE